MNNAAQVTRNEAPVTFHINREVSETRARALAAQIEAIPNVASATFISKHDGLKMLPNHITAGLGPDENPLPDVYSVTFVNLAQVDSTIREIMQIHEIQQFRQNEQAIQMIVQLTGSMQLLALILMAMMVAISVFIIANTIKLTVFARRRDINIMKFVGATDWFIRWPFIVEGIVIGIVGALVSFVVMWFGYGKIIDQFDAAFLNMDMFSYILPVEVLAPIMFVSFLIFGVVIGAAGSIISVRRHLNV
jgi:cell division transport system permease protein